MSNEVKSNGSGVKAAAESLPASLDAAYHAAAVRYLDDCADLYWVLVGRDWGFRAAGATFQRDILAATEKDAPGFLDLLSAGLAAEVEKRLGEGRLDGEEIELLHQLRTGSRSVAYRFYDTGDGWLLLGRDLSRQIELVSQMSVLIEDMESEMQRERALADRLRSLLSNDHLTGLSNRRHFERSLASRWESYVASGKHFSVISVDIDHFKAINDRYGHAVGDEVLKRVAKVLENCVRGGDLAARIGGEEFAVLTAKTTIEDAKRIAERIRRRLEVTPMPHGVGRVTLSAGVASTDASRPEKAEDLLDLADQALYRAKNLGRNRVEAAEPGK